MHILTHDDIRALLPLRKATVHKGSLGKILIIAGSTGMSGAALLASQAALRSGAGVVVLAVPKRLAALIDVTIPEVMTIPLPETNTGALSKKALPMLKELLPKFDTVLIGPGVSINKQTMSCIADLLQYVAMYRSRMRVVLDADGLRALLLLRRTLTMRLIITPHFGEAVRLARCTMAELLANPAAIARDLAKRFNCVVVLKSHVTGITTPRTKTMWVMPHGNPGMATVGSGDVLAGIITGLWAANGLTAIAAACSGTYVHALAGNSAARKRSLDGIIASDLVAEIPNAVRSIKGI